MGEIVFVRHGQASFGTDDYDRLSELGWRQARWLGEHLAHEGRRFHLAASGDLRRHRETATAIAEACGADDAVVLPGLNEMDFDVLLADAHAAGVIPVAEFTDSDDFMREFPKIMTAWETASFPTEHEPYAEFHERVTSAVNSLMQDGRDVLVVSSGGPKAVMMRHVLGIGVAKMAEVLLTIHNSSFSRFLVRNGNLLLGEFNATPHLAGPDRAHLRTYI
ncbi:MAG: histidine phosphatase family protein [Pseudomonadota bacterium]